MNIEIGSKWVKDGEVVEVIQMEAFNYDKRGALVTLSDIIIFFPVKNENIGHVLTERDFLEQYKPYEPVYEYRYAYKYNGLVFVSDCYYKNENEFITHEQLQNYQRLDFTKRERKQ